MKFFMDSLEPAAVYMGVNLGSSYIRMPKQHLHRTKISTTGQ